MSSKKYKIALIPPDGSLLKQDFTLHKIAIYLKELNNISVDLLYINDESNLDNKEIFESCIQLKDKNSMIEQLNETKYDLIIHRSWMHRYTFASILTQEFTNIVIYIKDWFEEMPQEHYKFLFDTDEDYLAIKKIFESKCKILSHYGKSYTDKLAEQYGVDKDDFIYFPEYCLRDNFTIRNKLEYKKTLNFYMLELLLTQVDQKSYQRLTIFLGL